MKLKLLFVPRCPTDPNTQAVIHSLFFPPLGISVLTRFLRDNGIDVDQDDLDVKVARHNEVHSGPDRIQLEMFLDGDRVARFFRTCEDAALEREAEKMLALTEHRGYDVFGLSLMPTINPSVSAITLALAKCLKKWYGASVLIGGNVYGQVEYELLRTGFVDARGIGSSETADGEWNLLNFCRTYRPGKAMNQIKGLVFERNGHLESTPVTYDLDQQLQIVTPSFEGLPMDCYRVHIRSPVGGRTRESEMTVIPYFYIRGCPHRCAFCSHARRPRWRGKEPAEVADDLETLSRQYGTNLFYFHNPTVNPTRAYAEAVADAIIARGLDLLWSDCANLSPLNDSLLGKLKRSGAARLVFGMESGSPSMLRFIDKDFSVGEAERALQRVHAARIWSEIDVITGFPYEYERDVDCTLRFFERNRQSIQGVSLNKFWLEGPLLHSPEKYGIRIRANPGETYLDWSVNGYDEIWGIDWDERRRITNDSYERLMEFVRAHDIVGPGIHYLYHQILHDPRWGVAEKE